MNNIDIDLEKYIDRIIETDEGFNLVFKKDDILAFREDAKEVKFDNTDISMTKEEKDLRYKVLVKSVLSAYVTMVYDLNSSYNMLLEINKEIEEEEEVTNKMEKLKEVYAEEERKRQERESEEFIKKTEAIIEKLLEKSKEEESKEMIISKLIKDNNNTVSEFIGTQEGEDEL